MSSAAKKVRETVATEDKSKPPPEPLRRAMPKPVEYPVDALGPLLGGAASALHSTVQAPIALCSQSVLAAASLAVQPHANVEIDGRDYPLSLYLLTVANSGDRKSAADRIALSAHTKYEREQIEICDAAAHEYTAKQAAYEVAMATAKKTKGGLADVTDAIKKLGPPPAPPPKGIKTVREPTVEALQKLFLSGATSLGLFTDEGAMVIGGYAMNSDNKLRTSGAFCKWWDDGSSDRIRAGDGSSKIYDRRVAMHIMTQPIVAEKILSDAELVGQGVLARYLIAWPETMAGTRMYKDVNPWGDIRIRGYADRMRELLETPPRMKPDKPGQLDVRMLPLSVEAKQIWTAAHDEIESRIKPGKAYSQIAPWAAKGAEQILRIAGVLTIAANTNAPTIEAQAVHNAAKLVGWYLGEAVRLVDVAAVPAKVKHAEAILKWARERSLSLVGSSQILQYGPPGVRDADTLEEAMDVLVKHGWATREVNAAIDGKPVRKAWRLRLD